MRQIWQPMVTAFWLLYVLLMGYFVLRPLLGLPLILMLLPLSTLAFFAFSLGHAIWTLGSRRAFLFLALTFGISLLFESVGVLTGWVYGPYHYTDRLGVKIFGLVPVVIPIAWFMMIYPSHVLVEGVGRALGKHHSVGWSVWMAGLSAMAMTAWDLVMDPLMVASGHWVWEVEGGYFGIPVHNYVGWLATTFAIFLAYRLLTAGRGACPWGTASPFFSSLPLWAYVVTWLGNVAAAGQAGFAGPALAGFFGMGTFALIGVGMRVWGRVNEAGQG